MKNEHNLSHYFKALVSNKTVLFFVIFTTVLSFGFCFGNFSIGVDDPARYHYLYSNHSGSMIQQGRLLHVLFNEITSGVEYLPFFNSFVGASLLALSALIFGALFQYVTNGRLSAAAIIAFCCVYISNPIINEKFIYELDTIVTMSSYCTAALALYYSSIIPQGRSNFFKALALLMLSIASYETFGFVYFCGVFAIFILRILVNEEKLSIKQLFLEGLRYALVLIAAFILYYALVFAVQILSSQYQQFARRTMWTILGYSFSTLKYVTSDIFTTLFTSAYYSIAEFKYFLIIGLVFFAYLSVRRRNPALMLCFIALLAGNFFIHFMTGLFASRTAQTFCLYIAFVVLVIFHHFEPMCKLRPLVTALLALLVFTQAAELNRWFYNDYIRYKKEAFAINAVATELVANTDISKPVIFTAEQTRDYFYGGYYSGGEVNGNSVLSWAHSTFEEEESPFMFELFRMHGYNFLVMPDSPEMIEQAKAESENMPSWPAAGSIVEKEDYIIVNF